MRKPMLYPPRHFDGELLLPPLALRHRIINRLIDHAEPVRAVEVQSWFPEAHTNEFYRVWDQLHENGELIEHWRWYSPLMRDVPMYTANTNWKPNSV